MSCFTPGSDTALVTGHAGKELEGQGSPSDISPSAFDKVVLQGSITRGCTELPFCCFWLECKEPLSELLSEDFSQDFCNILKKVLKAQIISQTKHV